MACRWRTQPVQRKLTGAARAGRRVEYAEATVTDRKREQTLIHSEMKQKIQNQTLPKVRRFQGAVPSQPPLLTVVAFTTGRSRCGLCRTFLTSLGGWYGRGSTEWPAMHLFAVLFIRAPNAAICVSC